MLDTCVSGYCTPRFRVTSILNTSWVVSGSPSPCSYVSLKRSTISVSYFPHPLRSLLDLASATRKVPLRAGSSASTSVSPDSPICLTARPSVSNACGSAVSNRLGCPESVAVPRDACISQSSCDESDALNVAAATRGKPRLFSERSGDETGGNLAASSRQRRPDRRRVVAFRTRDLEIEGGATAAGTDTPPDSRRR
jgi:hypothetical protein